MYNAVEFERAPHAEEWYAIKGVGPVFIVPSQVVKVERYDPYASNTSSDEGQGVDTVITLVTGDREAVKGPPSEVNSRLRRGT